MGRRIPVPAELSAAPFTTDRARSLGVSPDVLRGPTYRRLFRGVYVAAGAEVSYATWLRAALLILPPDAVVSHLSALHLWGLSFHRPDRFDFSTNAPLVTSVPGIVLHRRQGRLSPGVRAGLPVTGPDRTFVDCATKLSFVRLVQAGDWLVHTGATTIDRLADYSHTRHLSGVVRSRRAMAYLVEGAESPRETLVRLMLIFARLPHPVCNRGIVDAGGMFVARADLAYPRFKVIVEYDGWQHERDAWQRQHDLERRERLEAEGWRMVVITAADLAAPGAIPWRVYRALTSRGYEGPSPVTSATWTTWFTRSVGPTF